MSVRRSEKFYCPTWIAAVCHGEMGTEDFRLVCVGFQLHDRVIGICIDGKHDIALADEPKCEVHRRLNTGMGKEGCNG